MLLWQQQSTLHLWFQSAPDREAGRCGPSDHAAGQRGGFNPRPTVRPGDALTICDAVMRLVWFQSAPDREAGRCLHALGSGNDLPDVSIRARP